MDADCDRGPYTRRDADHDRGSYTRRDSDSDRGVPTLEGILIVIGSLHSKGC